MSAEGLHAQVIALQDSLAIVSEDHARVREMFACLEQRVRRLEACPDEPRMPCVASVASSPKTQVHEVAPLRGVALGDICTQEEATIGGDEAAEEASGEECNLARSLWDATFYVGLPQLSKSSSLTLLASMLLSAAVQFYICVVLYTSDDFAQRRRFLGLQGPMREWRLAEAHQHSMVDGMGRSLASRVCQRDQSLSQAVRQADILGEINAYLALAPGQLEQTRFGTGPLLCAVCVLLFAATVMRELRSVVVTTWAACALPRGKRTLVEDGRLCAISAYRLAGVLANNLVRAGISLTLLVTGATWLSSTTSTTDLVLNAAGLGFLMDMDECLFETIVPARVHMFVRTLKPLRYRRSRLHLESLLPLTGLVAIVLLSLLHFVQPSIEDMIEVKKILCGGHLDVSVATNLVGYAVSTRTMPFDTEHSHSLFEAAVDEVVGTEVLGLLGGSNPLQFSVFTQARSIFTRLVAETVESVGQGVACFDQDTAFDGYGMIAAPYIFTALRYDTGLHAGMTLRDVAFNCSEYAPTCHSSRLARVTCPVTCGCDDPTSGLLSFDVAEGCPAACTSPTSPRQRRIDSAPCADLQVVGTPQWDSYWAELLAFFKSAVPPSEWPAFTNFTEAKRTQGCNNMELAPVSNIDFCDANDPVLRESRMSGVASFCPASCCSRPTPPPDCPRSCSAR